MKNFKCFVLIIFLLFIYISLCAFHYSYAVSTNIRSNIFRLHVIANSNSIEDQNLKYKVRDKILEYFNNNAITYTNKKDCINFINNNIEAIKEISQNTIYENGYNYSVEISSGNFAFPTKTYGDIKFPAGYYDGLKIKIGEAEGNNWWCVMFPPLCFIDTTSGIVPDSSKNILENNLSNEEYNLISDNSHEMNIKFKIVEMFQNLNMKIAEK